MDADTKSGAQDSSVVVLPETLLDGISGIERAISQQTDWFKKWCDRVVVNHDPSAFEVNAITDIPLGKWYASREAEAFHSSQEFQALGKRLEEMLAQVQGFLHADQDGGPHPVDDYTEFMNTLLDLNNLVQRLQNDAWRGLTKVDPLTGVRNRHDMMAELDAERERARRTQDACSIAMADLDHFKNINDTHGHVVGDAVLRNISKLFDEQLRPYDTVYRYGGEEFLLCLPNTELGTAQSVLERLRVTIQDTPLQVDGVDEHIAVTASFGVAEVDEVEHIVKTIERADMGLYNAKSSGRNTVMAWVPRG